MLLRVLVSVVVGLRLNAKNKKASAPDSQREARNECGEDAFVLCLQTAVGLHTKKCFHFLFSKQRAKTLR